MHSFLSKVFGRKKEDKETSPTTLRPGELLDGKFEAISPNVSPGAANFLELDSQANADSAKDKDKDVGFSLFRAKSRPSPPEITGKKPDTLPHLSLNFSATNGDSNATSSDSLFALDLNSQMLLSDAIIGRRRLNPLEALVLIRACSQAIFSRGLETLGIMHPHWYSASPDIQRRLISQFIHSMEPKTPPTAFSPNSALASPFESEINFTRSPHDVAAVFRWGLRHLQLDGDNFGTDDGWYKAFLDAEAAAEYPPKAFSEKLAPLLPPAHLDLLIATLEVFSSLAAHSEVNSTSGSKLSKIFGLWLLTARQVEDKDDWQSFYTRWERTGRMLEHLFLSRIRDESTDQRMPVRLLELVHRYPYTQGFSSPTTDLQLLPPPRFTTQCHDALFVRIEVELSSERRKPKLKVHPLSILADAFSTKVEEGEFAELWAKITTASKNGSNPSPLSNIFADETIRFLSIIPDKSLGKAAEAKSPAFSLLPVSPSSPRGQSFLASETDKPTPIQHPKSATEPSPTSAASHIGSDWAQFSSSGFLDTTPAIAPLVSTLFDTDIEKTVPAVTTLSRKSSKRTKAASRKSVDFSSEPVKPIPEVQAEAIKKEPTSVVKATKLQVIQVDEAFIDFWSDSLLDPITATWPTFIICKFKSTLVPQLLYGPVEDGKQKTLKWLVLEQVITVKPAPTPAPLASPSVSVAETARPVSPALSTSGKNRFSFWSMSRTASSSSQSSQKGKKKEKALNVGEMGELLEEEATDQVKTHTVKLKSSSKSPRSTTEKPKEPAQKSVDALAAPNAVPTSVTEFQLPVADKVTSAEISDTQERSALLGLSAPSTVAATAGGAVTAAAITIGSQSPTSEVAKVEPTSEPATEAAQSQAETDAQDTKPAEVSAASGAGSLDATVTISKEHLIATPTPESLVEVISPSISSFEPAVHEDVANIPVESATATSEVEAESVFEGAVSYPADANTPVDELLEEKAAATTEEQVIAAPAAKPLAETDSQEFQIHEAAAVGAVAEVPVESKADPEVFTEVEVSQPAEVSTPVDEASLEEPVAVAEEQVIETLAPEHPVEVDPLENVVPEPAAVEDVDKVSVEPAIATPETRPVALAEEDVSYRAEPNILVDEPSSEEPTAAAEEQVFATPTPEILVEHIASIPIETVVTSSEVVEFVPEVEISQLAEPVSEEFVVALEEQVINTTAPETFVKTEVVIPEPVAVEDVAEVSLESVVGNPEVEVSAMPTNELLLGDRAAIAKDQSFGSLAPETLVEAISPELSIPESVKAEGTPLPAATQETVNSDEDLPATTTISAVDVEILVDNEDVESTPVEESPTVAVDTSEGIDVFASGVPLQETLVVVDEDKKREPASNIKEEDPVQLESNILQNEVKRAEGVPILNETHSETLGKESVAELVPVMLPVAVVGKEVPTEDIEESVPPANLDGAPEEEVHQDEKAFDNPPVVEHSTPIGVEESLTVVEPSPTEEPSDPVNIASSVPTVVPIVVLEDSAAEALIDLPPVPLVAAPIEHNEGTHVTIPVEDTPAEEPTEIEGVDATLNVEITETHSISDAIISAGSTPGPQTSLSTEKLELREVEPSPAPRDLDISKDDATTTEIITYENGESKVLSAIAEGNTPTAVVEDKYIPLTPKDTLTDGLYTADATIEEVPVAAVEEDSLGGRTSDMADSPNVEHQGIVLESSVEDSAAEGPYVVVEKDPSGDVESIAVEPPASVAEDPVVEDVPLVNDTLHDIPPIVVASVGEDISVAEEPLVEKLPVAKVIVNASTTVVPDVSFSGDTLLGEPVVAEDSIIASSATVPTEEDAQNVEEGALQEKVVDFRAPTDQLVQAFAMVDPVLVEEPLAEPTQISVVSTEYREPDASAVPASSADDPMLPSENVDSIYVEETLGEFSSAALVPQVSTEEHIPVETLVNAEEVLSSRAEGAETTTEEPQTEEPKAKSIEVPTFAGEPAFGHEENVSREAEDSNAAILIPSPAEALTETEAIPIEDPAADPNNNAITLSDNYVFEPTSVSEEHKVGAPVTAKILVDEERNQTAIAVPALGEVSNDVVECDTEPEAIIENIPKTFEVPIFADEDILTIGHETHISTSSPTEESIAITEKTASEEPAVEVDHIIPVVSEESGTMLASTEKGLSINENITATAGTEISNEEPILDEAATTLIEVLAADEPIDGVHKDTSESVSETPVLTSALAADTEATIHKDVEEPSFGDEEVIPVVPEESIAEATLSSETVTSDDNVAKDVETETSNEAGEQLRGPIKSLDLLDKADAPLDELALLEVKKFPDAVEFSSPDEEMPSTNADETASKPPLSIEEHKNSFILPKSEDPSEQPALEPAVPPEQETSGNDAVAEDTPQAPIDEPGDEKPLMPILAVEETGQPIIESLLTNEGSLSEDAVGQSGELETSDRAIDEKPTLAAVEAPILPSEETVELLTEDVLAAKPEALEQSVIETMSTKPIHSEESTTVVSLASDIPLEKEPAVEEAIVTGREPASALAEDIPTEESKATSEQVIVGSASREGAWCKDGAAEGTESQSSEKLPLKVPTLAAEELILTAEVPADALSQGFSVEEPETSLEQLTIKQTSIEDSVVEEPISPDTPTVALTDDIAVEGVEASLVQWTAAVPKDVPTGEEHETSAEQPIIPPASPSEEQVSSEVVTTECVEPEPTVSVSKEGSVTVETTLTEAEEFTTALAEDLEQPVVEPVSTVEVSSGHIVPGSCEPEIPIVSSEAAVTLVEEPIPAITNDITWEEKPADVLESAIVEPLPTSEEALTEDTGAGSVEPKLPVSSTIEEPIVEDPPEEEKIATTVEQPIAERGATSGESLTQDILGGFASPEVPVSSDVPAVKESAPAEMEEPVAEHPTTLADDIPLDVNIEDCPAQPVIQPAPTSEQEQHIVEPTLVAEEPTFEEVVADNPEPGPPVSLQEPAIEEPGPTEVEETVALEEPTETLEKDIPSQGNDGISVEQPAMEAALTIEEPLRDVINESTEPKASVVKEEPVIDVSAPTQDDIHSQERLESRNVGQETAEPPIPISADETINEELVPAAVGKADMPENPEVILAEDEPSQETPEISHNIIDESIELEPPDEPTIDEFPPAFIEEPIVVAEEPVAAVLEDISLEQGIEVSSDQPSPKLVTELAERTEPELPTFREEHIGPEVEESIVPESVVVEGPTATIDESVVSEESSKAPDQVLEERMEVEALFPVDEPSVDEEPAPTEVVDSTIVDEPTAIIDEVVASQENSGAFDQVLEEGTEAEVVVSAEAPAVEEPAPVMLEEPPPFEAPTTTMNEDVPSQEIARAFHEVPEAVEESIVKEEPAPTQVVESVIVEEPMTTNPPASVPVEQPPFEEPTLADVAEPVVVEAPTAAVNEDIHSQEITEAPHDVLEGNTDPESSIPTEEPVIEEPAPTEVEERAVVAGERPAVILDDIPPRTQEERAVPSSVLEENAEPEASSSTEEPIVQEPEPAITAEEPAATINEDVPSQEKAEVTHLLPEGCPEPGPLVSTEELTIEESASAGIKEPTQSLYSNTPAAENSETSLEQPTTEVSTVEEPGIVAGITELELSASTEEPATEKSEPAEVEEPVVVEQPIPALDDSPLEESAIKGQITFPEVSSVTQEPPTTDLEETTAVESSAALIQDGLLEETTTEETAATPEEPAVAQEPIATLDEDIPTEQPTVEQSGLTPEELVPADDEVVFEEAEAVDATLSVEDLDEMLPSPSTDFSTVDPDASFATSGPFALESVMSSIGEEIDDNDDDDSILDVDSKVSEVEDDVLNGNGNSHHSTSDIRLSEPVAELDDIHSPLVETVQDSAGTTEEAKNGHVHVDAEPSIVEVSSTDSETLLAILDAGNGQHTEKFDLSAPILSEEVEPSVVETSHSQAALLTTDEV